MSDIDIAARVDREAAKLESIALAVIGRVASWLAPVPVAVMTARAISKIFGLGPAWSLVVAAAQELVGMTTTSLWLTLADYNATKRKSDPMADEKLAKAAMILYFTVDFTIIAVVTVKDVVDSGDWSHITAVLFPVMAGVGVIVLNQRVRHYRRLAQIAAGKAQKSASPRKRAATIADVRAITAQLDGKRATISADDLLAELEQRDLYVKKRRTVQDWAQRIREERL